jgi:hypothetical protein
MRKARLVPNGTSSSDARGVTIIIIAVLSLVAFVTSCGGGGGGSSSGSSGATIYDGTYIGQFLYDYQEVTWGGDSGLFKVYGPWHAGVLDVRVTFKSMESTADAVDGELGLWITNVYISDPSFGTGLNGIKPEVSGLPESAMLPANPPTSFSNPSHDGMGISIVLPNGAVFNTAYGPGELSVDYNGGVLSYNINPGSVDQTWYAHAPTGMFSTIDEMGIGDNFYNIKWKSWSLTKSSR